MNIQRIICIFVAFSATLFGQASGRITGSVMDASGAPVAGATVHLNMAGAASVLANTTTSSDGLFSFAAVQAGSYDLSVENAGFAKFTARGVTVNAARETSLAAVRLEVKSVEQ